ncbi:MAG: phage holin family protein [Candidatus Eremiobacteraeota bacterium]|nr:phage holin family protein [Candidatus Eremiobacteraeota bacterium]
MTYQPNDGEELHDESIGGLFKRLSGDMALLMRQELELFRTEMTEKMSGMGKRVGEGAGMLSGAAVAGIMALGCLSATIILALALVMPAWAAALIVTIVYGIVAAVMAIQGKHKIDDVTAPVPRQTIETVKEDVEWAKRQASSVKR